MPACSQCGIENPDHTSFCLECGCAFSEETGKLTPDSVLEGRYVIVKVLGRGGMGAVYQAVDQRLKNSLVAVKEMSATALGKDNHLNAVSAFEKEAAMLIGLRHPALPRISDFFSKHDRWYLVMDYIEGETLADALKRRGAIPEPEVRAWGIQLCEILDYLHSQTPPVIFRDLKPANIMITPDGRIKLIDFGIARHFRPGSTADTTAYGSSGYAPPEQYGDNQTDARSDIYALGAVLHHLLTGKDPVKNPFNFESPGKIAAVSLALEAVIMKALELKPADRPATVREVLALLRDEVNGSPVNKGFDPITQAGGETAQFDTAAISGETGHQSIHPMQAERGGETAICSNCGAELGRNANFCRNCGAHAGAKFVYPAGSVGSTPRTFKWIAAALGGALLLGAGAYGVFIWNTTDMSRTVNTQALSNPVSTTPQPVTPPAQPVTPTPQLRAAAKTSPLDQKTSEESISGKSLIAAERNKKTKDSGRVRDINSTLQPPGDNLAGNASTHEIQLDAVIARLTGLPAQVVVDPFGSHNPVTIIVNNTGTETWMPGNTFALDIRPWGRFYNGRWMVNKSPIRPGQTATFECDFSGAMGSNLIANHFELGDVPIDFQMSKLDKTTWTKKPFGQKITRTIRFIPRQI